MTNMEQQVWWISLMSLCAQKEKNMQSQIIDRRKKLQWTKQMKRKNASNTKNTNPLYSTNQCTGISHWCIAGQSLRGTCRCSYRRCWCIFLTGDTPQSLLHIHPHLQERKEKLHRGNVFQTSQIIQIFSPKYSQTWWSMAMKKLFYTKQTSLFTADLCSIGSC